MASTIEGFLLQLLSPILREKGILGIDLKDIVLD